MEGFSFKRTGLTLTAGLALWLAAAAPASAADYYVDRDVVDASNNCLLATPCDTIPEALTFADASDASVDTIHVGFSTVDYGAITVPDTPVTLVGNDFNAPATGGTVTTINGVAAAGVVISSGTQARTIRGFTIQGGATAGIVSSLESTVTSGVTIEDNLFNEPSAQLDGAILAYGSTTIRDNVITTNATSVGLEIESPVSPVVTGNTISGSDRAIYINGSTGSILVEDNTIEVRGAALGPSAGIYLHLARGDVRDNLITMNPAAAVSNTDGIYASNESFNTLRLARNQVLGFTNPASKAVDITGPTGDPVRLNGDLLAGNTSGIGDNNSDGDLTLTNVTIWGGTGSALTLQSGAVGTIDSSIIDDPGVAALGGSTCSSTFSRGPAAGACGPFATNAAPSFNSLLLDGSGYRLTPAGNATLIDTGNPAAAAGVDLDGDSLILDGITDSTCLARRDIGADEVPAAPSNCPPPPGPVATGQRAAALKKCKKKKSAKKRKKCRKRARRLPV